MDKETMESELETETEVDTLPLPSPLREDELEDEDFIGDISSSSESEEGENMDFQEENRSTIPIGQKAYLSFDEALKLLVQKDENLLDGWTVEEITGLVIQLTKYSHEDRGIKTIVKNFINTKEEEIANCIQECNGINRRAAQERFRFQETIGDGQELPKGRTDIKFPNWFALTQQARKSRGIPDESTDVIAKFLIDHAVDNKESSVRVPDYSQIYSHLASLVQGYAVKGLKGIEAAVTLDIFEQMKHDIDSMPDLKKFFKKMYQDVQSLPNDEFRLDDVDGGNAGNLINQLEFPETSERFNVASLMPQNQNDTI